MLRRLIACAAALTLALPAEAQPRRQTFCAPRDALVAMLDQRYGEVLQGAGLQNATTLFELFASRDTGTWTLVLTRPDGTACAIAAGQHWQSAADAPEGKPI
jgi:hypothetical protein